MIQLCYSCMSCIHFNGRDITLPEYRALKIQEFLTKDFSAAYQNAESDALLSLVACLLPGDGITETTLLGNGSEARKLVLHGNNFQKGLRSLLKTYSQSVHFRLLTDGTLDLLRSDGFGHAGVVRSEVETFH